MSMCYNFKMKKFKFNKTNIYVSEKSDGNFRDRKNLERVKKELNLKEIFLPNQKHTNIVLNYNEDLTQPSDAVYTDKPAVAVGVLTADCIPLVLFNYNEISVIHAGWRGLLGGIVENAYNKFKDKSNMFAFVGPSIRGCCYEVGFDFIDQLNISSDFFTISQNKYFVDLNKILKNKLEKLHVNIVYEIDECTKCGKNFFSYRNGNIEERILTLAFIEGE